MGAAIDSPNPQLVTYLRNFRDRGTSYEQARASLIQAGWTESDIGAAWALVKEDGTPSANAVLGQAALDDQRSSRRQKAFLDAAAAEQGGGLYSMNNLLTDIGVSWWKWLLILVIVYGVVIALKLPIIIAHACTGIIMVRLILRRS